MPCAGWYSAAVAAGVGGAEVPGGAPLPVVGSVGLTSGELPGELEQPAATRTAAEIMTAAISLFITLLGNLLKCSAVAFPRRSERCAELVVLGPYRTLGHQKVARSPRNPNREQIQR